MAKTVLCYGDSNTYGYVPETGLRYPINVRYPGRLQMLLGSEYDVVEEGCNGRTTVRDDPIEGWKNGLDYLRPCINSHKPVDIVIMMLGTNDLKTQFHSDARLIADAAGVLVDVIKNFCMEKQEYVPKIILVSPPHIGEGIKESPFSGSFDERAIEESKKFALHYEAVSMEKDCIFFDAAKYIQPSEYDSLHLTAEAHAVLADKLADLIREITLQRI